MLRERFIKKGGTQAQWDTRMALAWPDVEQQHHELFMHDSIKDESGKWLMVCARCKAVGSHTAESCKTWNAQQKALQRA